jgi:hydroxymethylbilane synthase
MKKRGLILGTRGSALALAQATQVRALIHRVFPSLDIEIKIIKTSGDTKTAISLSQSGIKGIFSKELEQALLLKKIDLAVHSLKDMSTDVPAGLIIGAVLKRVDANDVVVFHPETDHMAPKRVFTSSPRRSLQTKLIWPEAETCEIRGNVETRLTKLAEGKAGEALLLAAAGLIRLDILSNEKEGQLKFDPPLHFRKLSFDEMLPAPGQAAIAIEIRRDDLDALEWIKPLNHAVTFESVEAERSFLRGMGGGCATPIAAYGIVEHDKLYLKAIVGFPGQKIWRGERSGPRKEATAIGLELANEYKKAQIS